MKEDTLIGHIASECPDKVVLTTTQHAIKDEEEQRYNFVVGKVEDLENEFDEEIQPKDKYNMIAICKVLFSKPPSD